MNKSGFTFIEILTALMMTALFSRCWFWLLGQPPTPPWFLVFFSSR